MKLSNFLQGTVELECNIRSRI